MAIAMAAIRRAFVATPTFFSQEIERGTLFLFLPVCCGIGAIIYFSASAEPRLSAILFGLTLLVGLMQLAHSRPRTRLALDFAVAVVAGMVAGKLETMRADTKMLGSDITTRLTGRVVAMARDARGGWRVTLDIIATERPTLRYSPQRVVVSARSVPAGMKIGAGLQGLVHLRPQRGPVRPGNYDFAFNNYYKGVGANGFFLGKPQLAATPVDEAIASQAWQTVANIRQQLTQRVLSRIKGEPGDIAASLITGQRDGISEATNDAMRLSGLSHILSISGFHMALVAGIIVGSLRASMALFPGFAARYPMKKLAAFVALAGSGFYLLLSGADVAAQRSFVMLAVMLIAMMADRAAISMRNLAIGALIAIALLPHEILGPSFQMSYSATGALIAYYGWRSRRKNRSNRTKGEGLLLRLPMMAASHVGAIAMTSLVAGTASSIFAAYHFNNTAPLGLVGNALALPVVSIFVMPFAVLAVLAMPFDLDWLPFAVMERGIEWVIAIAKMVSAHSPSGNFGSMPQTSLLLMTAGLVLLMLLTTRLRLVGFAVMALAIVPLRSARPPDIVIAEEGRLVALSAPDDTLTVNRATASRFTLDNWQQGYGAIRVLTPAKNGASPADGQFECADGVCLAREAGGLIVAYTDDPTKKSTACAEGDIVVLAFTGPTATCEPGDVLVITAQDLALRGSAEIKFGDNKVDPPSGLDAAAFAVEQLQARLQSANIIYAVGSPQRPWNAYRVFSRTARNLAEQKPQRRAAKTKPPADDQENPIRQ
ncbi:ComEC/Rec2-related protein [Phyllobacterium sp. CL33Tsu]|uniref:ComEC/Rec2 family competence protein n=1 Tax=Phyllobacterium sp. CL33Tsu TaxID=1798191 RepID=UPI0008E6ABFB|nr:ComEC/Rec2 family competence protein [Phyllobacterium sp. CL33Tsu]SFJ13392.1 ComEC/Rec2-related protein [Phyllobacterium sp. CL33Tsu]